TSIKAYPCYKVLSSKFFPSGDIFHPKVVDKPLYTWSSIATATKALENDFKKCPRCGANEETLIHTPNDCLTAYAILTLKGFDNRLLVGDYSCYIDWLEDLLRVLDLKKKAKTLYHDFRIYNLANKPVIPIAPTCKKWIKPPNCYIKINFNAFVSYAGLKTFEESLNVACTFNISKTVFEFDYVSLVNMVNNRDKDITILGRQINKACKQLDKLDSAKVVWANRSCNQVADFICDFAIKNRCNWNFNMDYLMDIHDLVKIDVIN
ncbi:hypothetical protein Golob_023870, partial [Gossypium lobatum]|nr:hypothetical protein [Gossypium lobatum]